VGAVDQRAMNEVDDEVFILSTVIASEAKQSRATSKMDCFVATLLAMTPFLLVSA